MTDLLVDQHEHHRVTQLDLSHHSVELVTGLASTLSVAAVHNKNLQREQRLPNGCVFAQVYSVQFQRDSQWILNKKSKFDTK